MRVPVSEANDLNYLLGISVPVVLTPNFLRVSGVFIDKGCDLLLSSWEWRVWVIAAAWIAKACFPQALCSRPCRVISFGRRGKVTAHECHFVATVWTVVSEFWFSEMCASRCGVVCRRPLERDLTIEACKFVKELSHWMPNVWNKGCRAPARWAKSLLLAVPTWLNG